MKPAAGMLHKALLIADIYSLVHYTKITTIADFKNIKSKF